MRYLALTYRQVINNMKGFNSLELYHKSNILAKQANYLLTVDTEYYSVKLFAWDRFFIEQYFDGEQVIKINIAGNRDMLKYLEKITLNDIGYPTVV